MLTVVHAVRVASSVCSSNSRTLTPERKLFTVLMIECPNFFPDCHIDAENHPVLHGYVSLAFHKVCSCQFMASLGCAVDTRPVKQHSLFEDVHLLTSLSAASASLKKDNCREPNLMKAEQRQHRCIRTLTAGECRWDTVQ